MKFIIRQISEKDAVSAAHLSGQLGYDISVEMTLDNINAIRTNSGHDAFVALDGDRVVGWIAVSRAYQIESAPCCEIRGLIVDELYRKKGVGKLLVEKAKSWCKEQGNSKLRVRCNAKRAETHLFYRHLGFRDVKEQKVFEVIFEKQLPVD
ncbi:MAG TPA: GNAT family N-acetyltransferase [Chitinophagaceae bacterium]|jgi:GNAT superfamily N-acetyltransferase